MPLNSMHLADSITTVSELLDSLISNFINLATNDCGHSGTTEDLMINYVNPLFLKSTASTSQKYNPNWHQAMNFQFADDYWEAAVTEIETIESMNDWEVVHREDDINVIESTWAFKLKRYPDGWIKNTKARFCARGDMHLEGIDFSKPMLQ